MLATDLHISSFARQLSPERLTALLAQLTDEEAYDLLHDWRFFARPEQLAPPGDWLVWTYLAGRGSGKTRSGAEWVRARVKAGSRHVALIAPTTADARKVMVEGISGILAVCSNHDKADNGEYLGRPEYEPSNRVVVWANGATATTYSAEEPNRLRGPQHDTILADELAAWESAQEAWDMAMFGLRVGDDPRAMVTTTPRPLQIIRELVKDPRNVFTKGTTWDNRANLADAFFRHVVGKYEGTRLGRQELSGEILEEADGALWHRDLIVKIEELPKLLRIVVGVDPPASSSGESALCGIVVAGLGFDGRGYVLADYSARMSPGEWGKQAVQAYDDWHADRIVAEGNQGGEMVSHTIQTVRENVPVSLVFASRSKQARAEPVAALYEQKKVSHVGSFPALEDEMCVWEPLTGMPSPDRLDAMVWAMTDLAIGGGAAVYQQDADQIAYDLDKIPGRWERVCVVDFDLRTFAAVWGAIDRVADMLYITDALSVPRVDLALHVEALRKRGKWIPTVFSPEERSRTKDEGAAQAERLADLGVDLYAVDGDPETSVAAVANRLLSARLKVSKPLQPWFNAYRTYRRREDGTLPEEDDHLMRATALLVLHGLDVAISENQATSDAEGYDPAEYARTNSTGY